MTGFFFACPCSPRSGSGGVQGRYAAWMVPSTQFGACSTLQCG